MNPTRIRGLSARDIRFPTSIDLLGSDAMHLDPDYSVAYVIIFTDVEIRGHGITFTIGRGNDLVVQAIKELSRHVVGKTIKEIYSNFSATVQSLTRDSQLRWVGPEKGVTHLATAAIVNGLFDLWARITQKPMWKMLVDMTPEQLVSTIDFTYIQDVLTKEEAIDMLYQMQEGKHEREKYICQKGYPAYTTATGWMGYTDAKIAKLLGEALHDGWTHFKVKVGRNLEDDKRRCAFIRDIIGDENKLLLDANQAWDIPQAIDWMKELSEFRPLWIEEPTSPDDILGHAAIREALKPEGIGVATGEMVHNRIMFKQLLQANAIDVCQIDAARMGGVPEVLAVYLMAKKFNIPVCPHAGGIGLTEMVQHLQAWDYICVSGSLKNRLIEYVDVPGSHLRVPAKVSKARYYLPSAPGYGTELCFDSAANYEYPTGSAWRKLFVLGVRTNPLSARPPYVYADSVENMVIEHR